MKAHYIDVWTLLLTVLGVAIVTILESKYLAQSEFSSGVEIACNPPRHFTRSHSEYTKDVCRKFWKTGDVYDLELLPTDEDSKKKRNQQSDWKQKNVYEQEAKRSLKKLLLGQTIVATVTFILLQTVIKLLATRVRTFQLSDDQTPDVAGDGNKSFDREEKGDSINRRKKVLKEMSRSRSLTIVYYVVLLIAALVWFIMAGVSTSVIENRKGDPSAVRDRQIECSNCTDLEEYLGEHGVSEIDVFKCDFKVRRLGNVHRYAVQCVVGLLQPKTVRNEGVFAAEVNTAMCFTIACLLLIHLLYTLVVAPILNKFISDGKIQFASDVHLLSLVNSE